MGHRIKVALRGVGTATFGKTGGESYKRKADAEKKATRMKRIYPRAKVTIVRG